MKKMRIFWALLLSLSLTFSFLSCSKGTVQEDRLEVQNQSMSGSFLGDSADMTIEEVKTESAGGTQSTSLTEGRKIIQNFEYHVETKTFDALLEKIKDEVKSLGGYIEESRTSGNRLEKAQNRYANMILRIPSARSTDLSEFLSKESVIVSENVRSEDVTMQYIDSESRVGALRSEKEALEEILKKASTVEEIISIRSQLTQVIYEIESYESKLRSYDNQVEYSTVSLSVSEVERITVVEEQNAFQEIATNLKNNFRYVGEGLVSIFVFLVSAIPFLLIPAVAVTVLIVAIHIKKKKK